MLQITTNSVELWDEQREKFVYIEGQTLQLEHSLVSLQKWESKWRKPFLSKTEKSREEILDYIRCMTITPNVNPEVYLGLSKDNVNKIQEYIAAPMTATTFSEDKTAKNDREIVTAEIIRYWMISFDIPYVYETWHLNSLLTLIRVCNVKNTPQKKRSKGEIMSRNAALNKARRQRLNSRG